MYKIFNDFVIRTTDNLCIPKDNKNCHWGEYNDWLSKGNIPIPQDERTEEEIKTQNANLATGIQNQIIEEIEKNERREKLGLPPILSDTDLENRKAKLHTLQGEVDSPSDDPEYRPLPVGIPVPPKYRAARITVTRQEGWQGALGWKAVINSHTEDFKPVNLALGIYSEEGCEGYQYTTGAFQEDDAGMWFAVCSPGFEPGEDPVYFSVLLGSVPVICFSLPQGSEEVSTYIFELTPDSGSGSGGGK